MKKLDKNENRKYYFRPYDPVWKVQFQEIRKVIQDAFGNMALRIEHIGSTSIEGMSAKPLIDVLVTVKSVPALKDEIARMEKAGYEWGRDYIQPDSLLFFKIGPEGEKTENIHVLNEGSMKARQFLVTRDYLRAHPDRARAYSELKETNAKLHPDDYIAYRTAKADFLKQLEIDAYEWERSA